jgi:hypothetical protein
VKPPRLLIVSFRGLLLDVYIQQAVDKGGTVAWAHALRTVAGAVAFGGRS